MLIYISHEETVFLLQQTQAVILDRYHGDEERAHVEAVLNDADLILGLDLLDFAEPTERDELPTPTLIRLNLHLLSAVDPSAVRCLMGGGQLDG